MNPFPFDRMKALAYERSELKSLLAEIDCKYAALSDEQVRDIILDKGIRLFRQLSTLLLEAEHDLLEAEVQVLQLQKELAEYVRIRSETVTPPESDPR